MFDHTYKVTLTEIGTDGFLLLSFQDVIKLAQAAQIRRDFVSTVSHKLRTPLDLETK